MSVHRVGKSIVLLRIQVLRQERLTEEALYALGVLERLLEHGRDKLTNGVKFDVLLKD